MRISGVTRQLALQLHRRAGNEVYGYALGGSSGLTVSAGRLAGSRLSFTLRASDPGGTAALAISGTIAGATFAGTARLGAATQPVRLTRQPAATVLHERRIFFAQPGPEGEPAGLTEVAVALDAGGRLVAGGFVGVDGCALFGCAGGVRTFREVGEALDIGLHPAGGCAAGSALHATFDPESRFYAGSFTLNTCPGSRSDDLIGARGPRARSDHVAAMLATLARLADDLEARRTFAPGHPAFWSGYLHSGARLGARLAELNAQTRGFNPLQVTFDRFRAASSIEDPTTLASLDRPFGLDFHDRRVGKPAGGGAAVVLRDADMETLLVTELAFFRQVGAAWVLAGDQLPAFDLPFAYTPAADHLKITTPGGAVYVSLGPWGAHFTPLTGHAYGDAKPNLAGFLAHADAELVELAGNGDGVRQAGETWGYWGGGDGSRVRNRVPVFRSPYAGQVERVIYEHGPTGVYFDDPPHWRVEVRFPNRVELSLVHVARLAPALRDLVLDATGIDTDSYSGPTGDLLDGQALPIPRHAPLAIPHVMAREIPGHPGYYQGGGTFEAVPWAQMEFFLVAPVGGPAGSDVCYYQHLLPAKRAQLQAILDADVANPRSERFTNPFGVRWQWGAEGALCNGYSTHPDDFASLHTRLGGWFERGAPGTTADEIFAIVPIAKGAAAYRAADYSSPAVSHLVLRRRRTGDGPFAWTLPGGIVAHPFYPAGEVVAQTSTALLIKWRDIAAAGDAWYQRAAYRLDAAGLEVEWGAFAASAAAAPLPVLGPAEACNDTTVLCYDHEHRPGF